MGKSARAAMIYFQPIDHLVFRSRCGFYVTNRNATHTYIQICFVHTSYYNRGRVCDCHC